VTAPTCSACTRPVADNARLCQRCTERFARDLGDIGALAQELQTTRLRQSRIGGQATGVLSRSSERPLPWDQRASEAADVLRSTVVAWVRVVLEERGARCPVDSLAAMGTFLLSHREWLRHHEAADECADEIGHATKNARHVIDRAPGRSYAGPCRETIQATDEQGEACCLAELHVRDGAKMVTCPLCSAEHDVADRKAWLLAVAENQLVTASELHRLLQFVGQAVPHSTIRSWVHRSRLAAHGQTPDGHPLYRVGDAFDLLVQRKASA
jgi:hypothetical protein